MDNNIAVVLEKVKGLLNPDSWVKHEYASNRFGWAVIPTEPEASHWCLVGAVFLVCAEQEKDPLARAQLHRVVSWTLAVNLPGYIGAPDICCSSETLMDMVSRFNDHARTGLDEVYGVLDRAIEQARLHENLVDGGAGK